MYSLRRNWWGLLMAGLLLAACAPGAAQADVAPPLLVTADPNATATPTPFQPAFLISAPLASPEATGATGFPTLDPTLISPTLTATLPPELDPALTPTPIPVLDDRELDRQLAEVLERRWTETA